MEQYDFWADALNKFSQFTPWVQVAISFAMCAVVLGVAYFIKEIMVVVVSPFKKQGAEAEPKKEWQNKYHRPDDAGGV